MEVNHPEPCENRYSPHLYTPSPIPLLTRIRLAECAVINRYTTHDPDAEEESLRQRIQKPMDVLAFGSGERRDVYELPSEWVLGKGR